MIRCITVAPRAAGPSMTGGTVMAKIQAKSASPAVPISLKNSLRDFSLNEAINLVQIYEASGTLPTAPLKVGILAAYYWRDQLYFSPEFWKSLKRCPPQHVRLLYCSTGAR